MKIGKKTNTYVCILTITDVIKVVFGSYIYLKHWRLSLKMEKLLIWKRIKPMGILG